MLKQLPERQKVEAEIALKRAVAEADLEIEQKKMSIENEQAGQKMMLENKQEEQKMMMEMDHKKAELDFEKQCKAEEQLPSELPKIAQIIESGFTDAIEGLTKAITDIKSEVVTALQQDKTVTVKRPDGTSLNANVRVLN